MISKTPAYYNYTQNTSFNYKQTKRSAIFWRGELLPSKVKAGYCPNISFGDVKHLAEKKQTALELIIPETFVFTNPSIIRSPDKLSAKDVINKFDKQLNLITAEDIENTIVASFDKNDRELILKALQHVCQFANIESLNKMCQGFNKLTDPIRPLYTEINASLSSNIRYLQNKDNFENLNMVIVDDYKYIPNVQSGSIVLDNNLLKRLNTDTALLKNLKANNNINIIYPEGWINGVNLFNLGSVEDIKERVEKVVTRAREIQQLEKLDTNNAITKALNEPVTKEMERLGLTNKLNIISTVSETETPNTTDIEKLLAPNRMSEETLQKIIDEKIPENYRQLVLEILARDTNIYSPRKLNALSKKLHKEILQMAQNKGIKEENIYYLIPIGGKSFGMSTMTYQIANNISPEKILKGFHIKIPTKEKSMVVILDDFAGSGHSMLEVSHDIKRTLIDDAPDYTVEGVLAPFVSTNTAVSHVNKILMKRKIEEANNTTNNTDNTQKTPDINLNYCPGEVIEALESTDFYKSLGEKDQKLVDKILCSKGYENNGVSVVFPYMGPDNNNYLFASLCAPSFSLNGNGVNSKKRWRCPIAVNLAQQEQQLKEIVESSKKAIETIDISKLYTEVCNESDLFTSKKLSKDIQKYISIANKTNPQPIDKLSSLTLLSLHYQHIISAVNKLQSSLKKLNTCLNDSQNYQVGNFEELYDKSHDLDKPLYDIMLLCIALFNDFTKEDHTEKELAKQIATLKTSLTQKIDTYTKTRNTKGSDFTQNEEEYLTILNSFSEKINLLDKKYQETLNMFEEVHKKLLPFANKSITNIQNTFREPRALFNELSMIKQLEEK